MRKREEDSVTRQTGRSVSPAYDRQRFIPLSGTRLELPQKPQSHRFVLHVLAGQNVSVTQAGDGIWLVSFMQYDLGYFDHATCRLEPIQNPFGSKVLPMSPE